MSCWALVIGSHGDWAPWGRMRRIGSSNGWCGDFADDAFYATDTFLWPGVSWVGGPLSCLLLFGLFVLLTLALWILLHVAVLADTFRVLGLVWAASGTLRSTLLEVAICAHAFSIILLVGMFALANHILLADHGLVSLCPIGAASWPFLPDQLRVERDLRRMF